jgi:hypothetical protein
MFGRTMAVINPPISNVKVMVTPVARSAPFLSPAPNLLAINEDAPTPVPTAMDINASITGKAITIAASAWVPSLPTKIASTRL